MFEGRTSDDLLLISDAELDARLQAMAVDLAIADSKIEPSSLVRRRARKLFRGVLLNVAGILLAAPTGGVTLLVCVVGVIDMLDAIEEDAAARSLQIELREDLERFGDLYERIAAEKASRGQRARSP